MPQHPELFLKKHEEKRLKQGHLWVFSNEIDNQRSPLSQFNAGDIVTLKDAQGKALGTAYVNPNTLICARLLSRKPDLKIAGSFFKNRLMTALSLRQRLFDKPFYRLVFAESDGLPGLIIDRFGDVLSLQINTAGMERFKDILLTSLIDLLAPTAIIVKNDNSSRQLEGLSTESEVIYGTVPEPVIIEENHARFYVDILNGQKTGWFYDHRVSRARLAALSRQQTVLDLFSYSGAWGIPAAMAGASKVTCVDSSEQALKNAQHSAKLNHVSEQMQFAQQDVFDFLKQAREQKQRYDIIVLDPPALIKRKKDFKAGFEAYRRLNHLALQVLNKQGILISASCSYHLNRANLHEILRSSARHIDRHLLFFETQGQGPDHPIHPALAESEYLKTFFCTVSPSL
ncbi:class I SAM-dependent rRNA methyltransferase [methane-oxidizing endosymbiont of Gigantopelta aegis]|uniref:class I SAM-dependent rRNA methyltransferase n=1 Tax=methane-oxidizing endosymbiont of Gigantopelta aegis TaxID=2794938 RepID=UPI0018DDDA40|nr:class I SAM-dependent rRNA methyltransferase [methane-oxidizing endosymbiont of Gigantopelta aegis]